MVFIMGTLATVSLTFIEGEDGQLRYEQSVRKMNVIGEAIVKVRDYQSQQLLSGFVFDNGVLPPLPTAEGVSKLRPLIGLFDDNEGTGGWSFDSAVSIGWDSYGLKNARYIGTGGVGGVNDFPLDPKFGVLKGYRGPYVPSSLLDSGSELKDAWGVDFVIDTSSDHSYEFTLSNVLVDGETTKFSDMTEVSREVAPNDWSVTPLSSLSFRIVNNSDEEMGLADQLSVALLVYTNSKDTSRWITYKFDLSSFTAISPLAADGEVIVGLGGPMIEAWHKNGEPIDVGVERVPVGRHLFVLVDEAGSEVISAQQVVLYPKSSLPMITLEYPL